MPPVLPGRVAGLTRPPPVTITFADVPIPAHPGESLAAALIAAGHLRFGEGDAPDRPRAAFCLMGTCQGCLVRVDGRLAQACLLPVRDGLAVTPA